MVLVEDIKKLQKEKNALILAHYYVLPEVQEIADVVGDSLALAQAAQRTQASVILFAGVHFMAETAKILNPSKTVLIPDLSAGCSLAESCPAEKLSELKVAHPDHKVISYINCSAAVKCLSDVIVTSSNALKIVSSFPENEKLIFAPDRNLGAYINEKTGRNMVLYNGACHVHDLMIAEDVIRLKCRYPQAKVLAHPECKAAVLALADFTGSTSAMLQFTSTDTASSYIIATENGILHEMKKQSPEKEFIIVDSEASCACSSCEYMKKNTLEAIYNALLNENLELLLDPETIEQAQKPILRMLKLS